ncbi:hypothetical protein BASA81_000445 [Batrachochytrium salamandrivorans]|nr:hypothetical protein BASA81_000445 [Batrachochytrium salamandrivorans]
MSSLIVRQLPRELTPNFVNGTWRKPKYSAMHRAKLRKDAIAANKFFVGADLAKGEWDPYWGAKYERNLTERVANIQKNLLWTPIKMKELKEEKARKFEFTPWETFFRKHKMI